MNSEQSRLETFMSWPPDAVVSPSRIAKAGFFYTKRELIVECFACHLKLSEWNYGDQVMTRHKTLSPTCPFVLNPTTSGNVPIISQQALESDNMKDEGARLLTFTNWPISHIVSPQLLARAGFYYLKVEDHTKCAFCKGVVRAWEPGDDPDEEHKRHFGECPFVLTQIIPRLQETQSQTQENLVQKDSSLANLNLVNDSNMYSLGVHTHIRPKRTSYITVEARLRSFAKWPPDLIQTPDTLAAAGFYYEGVGDQVRCFHCDGGLRHWDPQDDPWTEHARWFPRCAFIKLVKGQDFVNACSLELHSSSNLEEVDRKNNSHLQTKRHEVTERELQEHLSSEAAMSALGIGLNVERVKRAIREKLEQTGRGYSQPDALVEAALNLQHDEDDTTDEENSVVANQVKNVLDNLVSSATEKEVKKASSSSSTNVVKEITECRESSNGNKSVSLEEENRILKEARLCKICMDAEVGIVFLPCGHLTTCVNCAPNLEDCPVCRCAIKATVRTFLS